MRVLRSSAYPLIPILVAGALFGCSQGQNRNSLAPSSQMALGTSATASETQIVVPFDPANFVNGVQNPLFPLVPGTVWTYRQETREGVEINTVEVTKKTKDILGVKTIVVHDQVFLEGSLSEDTFDWYAYDKDGNVWYFGEDTKELGPPVSTVGSWEAGQNGAKAGVIMLAHPEKGDTYQQEDSPGVVADQAKVIGLDETAIVPYGTFTGCLKTQEWTPLEPGDRSFKLYAPGVGNVMEIPNKTDGPLVLTGLVTP